MNKREVRPHVYLLEFQTQAELASTFLRFQEHYESPEFKGKIFTRAEFEKWYAGENGSFSYCSDWSGFNIPSIILEPFRAGSFNPLSLEEQNFLKHFEGLEHPFYIIGTYSAASPEKQQSTLKHETAHGLFHTNPEYKKEVLEVLEKYDLSAFYTWLSDMKGYHPDVYLDEAHAYGLTPSHGMPGVDPGMKEELEALFQKWG